MRIYGRVIVTAILWSFASAQYYLRDQTLGCDGVIGSGKTIDNCGECDGNNSGCTVISGIFTKRTNKAAYEYITEFPVGASRINITEAKNTRNYLALRYSDGQRSIINGNWSLDWSGDYRAAGTTIQYHKSKRREAEKNSGESIYIPGPLQEGIQLLLLVQTRNPGIYYRYTLPIERQQNARPVNRGLSAIAGSPSRLADRNSLPAYVGDSLEYGTAPRHDSVSSKLRYQWKIIDDRSCSQTCGEGFKEEKVVCILTTSQVTVTDENCGTSQKPKAEKVQCNTQPCAPRWETGAWSECSATCGRSTQTREVTCSRRVSSTKTTPVSAVNCMNSRKPSTVQMCPRKECYSWSQTAWSECSVKCGAGRRHRQVHCIDSQKSRVESALCVRDRPRHVEKCYSSCEESWFYGEWIDKCSEDCNEGNITRQIYCPADRGTYLRSSKCGTPPETAKACDSRPACISSGKWFTGEWKSCTGDCNKGSQTRDVVCLIKREDVYRKTDYKECDKETQPINIQKCRLDRCEKEATSAWFATDWSRCSVTCGSGYTRRQVKCLNGNYYESENCLESARPATAKPCSTPACPTQPAIIRTDPHCTDRYTSCRVVVQARLCKLTYYNKLCCESCNDPSHPG